MEHSSTTSSETDNTHYVIDCFLRLAEIYHNAILKLSNSPSQRLLYVQFATKKARSFLRHGDTTQALGWVNETMREYERWVQKWNGRAAAHILTNSNTNISTDGEDTTKRHMNESIEEDEVEDSIDLHIRIDGKTQQVDLLETDYEDIEQNIEDAISYFAWRADIPESNVNFREWRKMDRILDFFGSD